MPVVAHSITMNDTPIRSGNEIIDFIFDLCVKLLLWGADFFGVSYHTINVWIFCIIWPILTIALCGIIVKQHLIIRRLKGDLS